MTTPHEITSLVVEHPSLSCFPINTRKLSKECLFSLLLKAKPFFLAALLMIVTMCQIISMPTFLGQISSSFPPGEFSSAYALLLVTSTTQLILCGLFTIIWYFVKQKPPSPDFKIFWKLYFFMGTCLATNGFLMVYSSPPDRTPALLQAILFNTGIMWSIPATKLLVPSKASLHFCAPMPIFTLVLIMWGVGIALMPQIISVVNHGSNFNNGFITFIWSTIFVLAMLPGNIYNVLQERLFRKLLEETILNFKVNSKKRNTLYDIYHVNMWSNFFQFLTIIIFFWIDFVPYFGQSPSPTSFFRNVGNTLSCIFSPGSGNSCHSEWIPLLLFNCGFFFQTLIFTELNKESANFATIASMMGTPFSAVAFIILPELDPTPGGQPPLWSVLPSLLLLAIASFIWKWWETKESS